MKNKDKKKKKQLNTQTQKFVNDSYEMGEEYYKDLKKEYKKDK